MAIIACFLVYRTYSITFRQMFYEAFISNSAQPQIAVLIDPEKANEQHLKALVEIAEGEKIDWFFVGGSTVAKLDFDRTITFLKKNSSIPVVIFPGDSMQIHADADAILFLSLVSGRNPEYLIGQQVLAARDIYEMNLPVVPTAYILVNGGKESTTAKVTQTNSLNDLEEIIATALAGEMMGMKAIYLEAGSGANQSVSKEIISQTKKYCKAKIVVGGGIKTAEQILEIFDAGADTVVIGNVLEEDPKILAQICQSIKDKNRK